MQSDLYRQKNFWLDITDKYGVGQKLPRVLF